MKLTEFIDKLQFIASQMGSHPQIDDSLSFFIERNGEIIELDILEIEPEMAMGCNCWYGVSIEMKELK